MSWLKQIPVAMYMALVIAGLALYAGDVRGLYIAGALVLVAVGQLARDEH